jgi:hypothetical protein
MNEEAREDVRTEGIESRVAALAGELRSAAASARRQWLLTTLLFALLCGGVAWYLGWVLRTFRPYVQADALVGLAVARAQTELPRWRSEAVQTLTNEAPTVVAALDMDGLVESIPSYREQVADELRRQGPPFIRDQLSRRAPELEQQLPRMRQDATARIKAWIPEMLDEAMPDADQAATMIREARAQISLMAQQTVPGMVDELILQTDDLKEALPRVRQRLAAHMKNAVPEAMDRLLPQARADMEAQIRQVSDRLGDRLVEAIPGALDDAQPRIEELKGKLPEMREEMAQRLKDAAPQTMAELEPRLAELNRRIPEMTQKLSDALVEQAPEIANMLRQLMVQTGLPYTRSAVMSRARAHIEQAMPEARGLVDEAVRQILEHHAEDIKVLERDDLAQRLEEAFEASAGDVLDRFSEGVEMAIRSNRDELRELIQRKQSGAPLTRTEQLELRYIQLWKTFWDTQSRIPLDAEVQA